MPPVPHRHRLLQGFALALALPAPAWADEDGAAFWLSGQYASMSAIPPSPGWSLVVLGNGYRGLMDPMRTSATTSVDEETEQATLLLQPGYAFERKILGGTPYVSAAWGPGVATTQVDGAGAGTSQSQTLAGGSDLNPFASLSWNSGSDNFMTYVSLNVPVGSYEASRLANLGLGHAAIDWGAAYTYFDDKTGWEFSALAGLTYNWENPSTGYQNGIDSHIDWGASRWVSKNWQLGVAGYGYYQLTGDSGPGDDVGDNRSRVAAIGPQLGYQYSWKTGSLYASLRGYQEFWAKNRNEGQSVFLEAAYSWSSP